MKVLFVCTGNICRSPTADGVMRHLVAQAGRTDWYIDSAGVSGYHVGEAPDDRSSQTAKAHGVDMSFLSARQVTLADYDDFDLILAMDNGHLAQLVANQPKDSHAKVALFMQECLGKIQDVKDPYYGGQDGFERVFREIWEGCEALLSKY